MAVLRREVPQRILLVREPPRHGKSEHLSHWTPSWFMLTHPDKNLINVGHGDRFARKWGRRSRETFAELAPGFATGLAPERQAANNWGTIQGGGMITAGVGGSITGEGADLLIVDDLIKNAKDAQSENYREGIWDWFRSTAWTRLEPDGVCVAIGTSWHRDDVLSRIRTQLGEDVLEICLPAIAEHDDPLGREPGEPLWPDRISAVELENRKRTLGPYYWNALYQQRPIEHEHAEWDAGYFENIWADYWPEQFELSVLLADPAKGVKGGDFAACVFAGLFRGNIYVDARLERIAPNRLVEVAATMATQYKADAIGFEANAFQFLIAPEFDRHSRQLGLLMPSAMMIENHNVPKPVRIRRLSGWLNRVRLRRGSPGCELLLEQLRDFPLADHDDGPDALEMAIRQLNLAAAGYAAAVEPEVSYR